MLTAITGYAEISWSWGDWNGPGTNGQAVLQLSGADGDAFLVDIAERLATSDWVLAHGAPPTGPEVEYIRSYTNEPREVELP